MKTFKEKAPVFLLGLMFGLIIAGGFFILKLDDYFKELNVYKSLAASFSSKPDSPVLVEKHPVSSVIPKKNKNKRTESAPAIDSASVLLSEAEPITDTVQNVTKTDTLSEENNIVVRKDELLSTVTLEVLSLDPLASRPVKDSVLHKLSGIRDDRSSGKQMFNIEFWASPLNYKGYKMGKYKIILYGFSSADAIKLYKLDDTVYIKSKGSAYRLEPVSEFKAYEKVTDEGILARLK